MIKESLFKNANLILRILSRIQFQELNYQQFKFKTFSKDCGKITIGNRGFQTFEKEKKKQLKIMFNVSS